MYSLEIEKKVYEQFEKLSKKDKQQLIVIDSKIKQILENPDHFKPLRFPMAGFRRVHILKSFVLVYRIDEARKTVIIVDCDRHDKIYNHWSRFNGS